jgi:hypothetical protein
LPLKEAAVGAFSEAAAAERARPHRHECHQPPKKHGDGGEHFRVRHALPGAREAKRARDGLIRAARAVEAFRALVDLGRGRAVPGSFINGRGRGKNTQFLT